MDLIGARGAELRHPDMAGSSGLTNRRIQPPLPDASEPSTERRGAGPPFADQTAGLQPQGQERRCA